VEIMHTIVNCEALLRFIHEAVKINLSCRWYAKVTVLIASRIASKGSCALSVLVCLFCLVTVFGPESQLVLRVKLPPDNTCADSDVFNRSGFLDTWVASPVGLRWSELGSHEEEKTTLHMCCVLAWLA